MERYINEIGVNVGRSAYNRATDAALTVFETREILCRLFNFRGPVSQVVFTPGLTFGLNLILKGCLSPGDHVIVSSLEHNAVMRPLTELSDIGIEFSRIPADAEGMTDAKDILPVIRPETKLVLVSHASNVSGGIFPLSELSDICRDRGIPLVVDAAQTAGHLPIDFDSHKLSALCVPGHKGLLGPQGVGAVIMEKTFSEKLRPLVSGGTGSASASERQPSYMPDRFESGTLNIPGIYGLNAAVSYLLKRGVESIRKREIELTARFLSGVKGLPLRIAGPSEPEHRVGTVSLDFTGLDNAEVTFMLEREYGILVRCGLHCAPNAHKTLGSFPQGTVRFSVGHTTSEKDIDAAVKAIRDIVKLKIGG